MNTSVVATVRRTAEMRSRELAQLRLLIRETHETLDMYLAQRTSLEREIEDLCDFLEANQPRTHPLEKTWRERLIPAESI
jgi:hypothetical protein